MMETITISEQLFLLGMDKRGRINGTRLHTQLSVVMAGLLDLRQAGVLDWNQKVVSLKETILPETHLFLEPLLENLKRMKRPTFKKIADQYCGTFTDKELKKYFKSIRDELQKKQLVTISVKSGRFGEKLNYLADEDVIRKILENIELSLEKGTPDDRTLYLWLLLEQTKLSGRYFSKEILKKLRGKLEQLQQQTSLKELTVMKKGVEETFLVLLTAVTT